MTITNASPTDPTLIAACGINCRLCRAYVREENACVGCRGDDTFKSQSCVECAIKNCEKLVGGKLDYCFECEDFPCGLIKRLEKRYSSKYGTSPISNLMTIQKVGLHRFVISENNKWSCPACGSMLCMHKPQCLSCGHAWRE